MTSTLDAVVLVALITGTITLLNSFYSRYSDQKNKKREYLASKREGPYSDLFAMMQKISRREKDGFVYTIDEARKDIDEFNSKLSLWGSPKVVKKWVEFRKKCIENEEQLGRNDLLKEVEENSAAQMAAKMHWDYRAKNFEEFPNNQKWFATGEALANLEHLRAIGKADYEFKDGVAYYRVKK